MIPKRGDILSLSVEPHKGYEVGGHDKINPYHPVLVVSSQQYNKSGFIIVMPIMSHNRVPKDYSDFLIPIHTDKDIIHGYVVLIYMPCYSYEFRLNPKHPRPIDYDKNEQDWTLIRQMIHAILL